MEAFKTVGVFPPIVVAKTTEPKKSLSLATISPFKNQSSRHFCNSSSVFSAPRTFHGGLLLLSSLLSSELAKALTYDEALQKSVSSFSSDFDVGGVLDGALNFAAENPVIVGGAAAVVAAPLVVVQLISKGKGWGVESAKKAYEKLRDDASAQLLDIRAAKEIKKSGGPDIRSAKKKAVTVVFNGEDKEGFLKRLSLKFKEPENTTLFILDKFDGNSEVVAELVTSNGFKAACAIKNGAEGWMNSGLPWILPKKSLDLTRFTDAISDAFGEASDGVPGALAVAVAAAGLGLLAFAEVESLLQILGAAALLQFATKKLLFAEDRKQTLQQIKELLNTKVAPKELPDDIQQIGKALLPLSPDDKALPAQKETTPAPIDSTVLKSEVPNPLSPYPNYPDYKPPSSPIPSQS